MQVGPNIVSLAGFTSTSSLTGLDSQLTPLTLWKKLYEIVMSGAANTIGSNSSQIQKHILNEVFHRNGTRLLMHLDLTDSPISGYSPVAASVLAQQLISAVTSLQLDGISILFGDYYAVAMRTASEWLDSLLTAIRSSTPNQQLIIVLILPPQFVPLMAVFKSVDINSLVDYFVLKAYGNVRPDYTDYSSLF
jgi:hypothetical protein